MRTLNCGVVCGWLAFLAAGTSPSAAEAPSTGPVTQPVAQRMEAPKGPTGVCLPFMLKDEQGKPIDPIRGVNATAPYSPKQTCGAAGCHNYARITEGFHFTQGKGEPLPEDFASRYNWVTSPGNYGGNWCSPAPLYRQLAPKKSASARMIDMTSFDFVTATCGNCHPGGGPLEYDRDGRRYDEWMRDPASGLRPGGENGLDGDYYKARWSETGVIEADCLLCHMPEYDYKKRNAELAKLNFRWAATVGAGLGSVTGKVAASERPVVAYDTSRFDAEGNVLVHMAPEPRNETCLHCHAKPGWKKRGASFTVRTDVHIKAGLRCVDCHASGSRAVDPRIQGWEIHQFGKGDDPSGHVRNDLDDTVRSCEGCHLKGWYNAPIARHDWLPPLHMQKITCQTCHIPQRAVNNAMVQASDVFNPAPRIQPPPKHIWTFYDQQMRVWNHYGDLDLFTVKDQPTDTSRPVLATYKGKIYPVNRVHSTWVGFEEEGKPGLNQLFMRDFYTMWKQHTQAPATAYPRLKTITDDNGDEMPEVNRPEEIDALLGSVREYLAKTAFDLTGRRLVWVCDDRAYYDGTSSRQLPKGPWEASPYASVYKYSHDVLPARSALGMGGCSDCHSRGSPFFFASVVHYPFDQDGRPVTVLQSELMGYAGRPRQYDGAAGATATFFRWLTIIVLAGMFIHIVLDVFARLRERKHQVQDGSREPDTGEPVQRFNVHYLAQHLVLMIGVVLLILSGVFQWGLRYPGASWAAALTGAWGGIDLWRVVHRVGGSVLILACSYHLVYSLVHPEGRRDFVMMLPRWQDFRDFAHNLMWFVGARPERPHFGRFTYFEKFDYWAVFWGSVIMIGTGLAMWFPPVVQRLAPVRAAMILDAFKEAHAHEALLAFLAIVIWHLYNVHLRPGRFPGSLFFLHGRMGKDEMTREHPLASRE